MERLEKISWILGRCHNMVNKIEQFNSMKDHTQHMTDVTMRMLQNINDRKDEFKDI